MLILEAAILHTFKEEIHKFELLRYEEDMIMRYINEFQKEINDDIKNVLMDHFENYWDNYRDEYHAEFVESMREDALIAKEKGERNL